MIKLHNVNFDAEFVYSYLKTSFGEAFAHSSLAFEKLFQEAKLININLERFILPYNTIYANKLVSGSGEDQALLEQRLHEIEDVLQYLGIPSERVKSEVDDEYLPCISDFKKYFYGAVRPYRNTLEIEKASNEGLLTGASYENETLIQKVRELAGLINAKVAKETEVKGLKKDNNDAFMYSLSLDKIGVPEIIDINFLVNQSAGLSKGFKRVDNMIIGCPFTPCAKEYVPIKMQELLYKYNGEWLDNLPKLDEEKCTSEQKDAYARAICEREAKFHIDFERIHPFDDGNGRTGRIVMNKNLIAYGLAPVFITPQMREIYLRYIDTMDYENLGNLIYMLSSVTLTSMISEYRKSKGILLESIDFDVQRA